MSENTTIPNTPQELVKQNQEPLSPEVIWEEYKKMSVSDQEKFIWNTVNMMTDFHHMVVDKMMKDETDSKDDVGIWIQDGTKWSMILRILHSMES